ncbi:MAG: sigma-70 family RNA polymerase sigma factor [Erysipelotrichaceae bacterium]|nr:sigma-70 family RNA polymerase sigma factor [Erysipelotrichaceae bacterium]
MNNNLLKRIREGDSTAFEPVLEENRSLITKVVNAQTTEYGDYSIDKDELEQIATIALYEACKKFDESKGMSFKSYAYMVIRSRITTCYSGRAKVYNKEYYSLNADRYAIYKRADKVCDSAYIYHKNKEFEESINEFINGLSSRDKLIIECRKQEMSNKEIAEKLNTTQKSVYNRLRYLLKKFMSKYE